ncbi:DUF2489 domain-containing protein [Natronospirillum operosum]|nr:DUF2489 domain-containing protein [Natronospirillum operosum]
MLTLLTVLALFIVLGLGAYAGWLHWRLWQHRRQIAQQEAGYQRQRQVHEDYLIDSIRIIAQNMVEEDLNISEGSIRIRFLLEGMELPAEERARFQAFDDLYEQVRELDTHQARQALTPQERLRQDQVREAHEREHRTRVLEAARLIRRYEFEGFGSGAGSD